MILSLGFKAKGQGLDRDPNDLYLLDSEVWCASMEERINHGAQFGIFSFPGDFKTTLERAKDEGQGLEKRGEVGVWNLVFRALLTHQETRSDP